MIRAMPSAEPPGGNGAMIVIAFCEDWLNAAPGNVSSASVASGRACFQRIYSSGHLMEGSVAAWLDPIQRPKAVPVKAIPAVSGLVLETGIAVRVPTFH
jgi:hypothetical protein